MLYAIWGQAHSFFPNMVLQTLGEHAQAPLSIVQQRATHTQHAFVIHKVCCIGKLRVSCAKQVVSGGFCSRVMLQGSAGKPAGPTSITPNRTARVSCSCRHLVTNAGTACRPATSHAAVTACTSCPDSCICIMAITELQVLMNLYAAAIADTSCTSFCIYTTTVMDFCIAPITACCCYRNLCLTEAG